MDYIRQLKGFRRKRQTNPIGPNSFTLYVVLFELCNDLLFPERFTAPNSVLQGYARLSTKALQRSRNELIQKGYIRYKNGAGNQCGSYELVDLSCENEFDSSFCPAVVPAIVPTNVQQSVPQMSNKVSILNNSTDKLNYFVSNNNIYARTREDVLNFFEKNMGHKAQPLIETKIDAWLKDVEASLICYAISEAVCAGICTWKYIDGILNKCKGRGIKTWQAAEETASELRDEKNVDPYENAVDALLLGGMRDA